MEKLPVTVVILTKDEEANIPGCLESVEPHCDDIHVLDSGSEDATCQIAIERGVRVHENPFRSFGQQRNWAIDNIDHKHDWVLHLDADERLTEKLAQEIRRQLQLAHGHAGFHIPSKLMLGRYWLRRSGEYPAYQLRLFNRHQLRFADAGHGQREVTNGTTGRLSEPYLHLAFNKGLDNWFAKHASYAALEAAEAREDPFTVNDFAALFRPSSLGRRRALKRLSYRIPFRGPIRLLHLLLVKGAILDGWGGILHSRMKSTYETMIELQIAAGDNASPADSKAGNPGQDTQGA